MTATIRSETSLPHLPSASGVEIIGPTAYVVSDDAPYLYLLDAAGVQCSTGSACSAGVPQPSHVLIAMGRTEEEARGSLRVSFGWTSTEADVDAVLAALPDAIDRARRAAGAA